MKRGRLPLTALRSFEAAGRHLSFSRAAEELFVSQAAVSRQIRELEAQIGRPLFERLHRRVELTDAGRELLVQLTRSFDDIDHRLSQIQADSAQKLLKISVEPYFGASWLMPRLIRFREKRPDIDVSVDVSGRLVEFRNNEAELAIRFSLTKTSWPRVQSAHLMDTTNAPVLSPNLLKSGPPLRQPADLLRHTLLHEDTRNAWSHWFEAAGIADAYTQRGPMFPDGALGIQAAILGHGVALGDRVINGEDLRSGRLVMPLEIEVPYGAYWLVAPDLNALSEPARAFADWLRNEIKAEKKA
jgi:LysR family glycine cleavage system transcriptional activator